MSSSLQIEERFAVRAPVERVWPFLLDPERLVVCLPGAQLTEVENETTFHGNMKVKVGPVTITYKGTIQLIEVDEVGRVIQLQGQGKESGGAGSAKMAMTSRLRALPEGHSEIVVAADVQLAGKIVRFGRGMIESVSRQLFKQFSDSVREILEAEAVAPQPALVSPEASTEASTGASTGASTEAVRAGAESSAPHTAARGGSPPSGPATRSIAPREVKPVRALPLLLRAIWDSLVGFFARVFGGRRGRD